MTTANEKVQFMINETEIRYLRCSEVEETFVHQAFQSGFCDYILKMEISKQDFIQRFFGPEGNSMENSFIAFYNEEPVGVILGGIRKYEEIKTMRCGALAISPNFRGTGISQTLFKLHRQEALKNGCKQLFLEVIVGNNRAIHFYKKLGYEKINDLVYFRNEDLSHTKVKTNTEVLVKRMEFQDFKNAIENWNYHINWQNDLDYIALLPQTAFFGAYDKGSIAGCLSINPNGGISFLMVEKSQRNKGIGALLLQTATKELQLKRMSLGFPNNSHLEGFLKKLGFKKDQLSQYEMYLVL